MGEGGGEGNRLKIKRQVRGGGQICFLSSLLWFTNIHHKLHNFTAALYNVYYICFRNQGYLNSEAKVKGG